MNCWEHTDVNGWNERPICSCQGLAGIPNIISKQILDEGYQGQINHKFAELYPKDVANIRRNTVRDTRSIFNPDSPIDYGIKKVIDSRGNGDETEFGILRHSEVKYHLI